MAICPNCGYDTERPIVRLRLAAWYSNHEEPIPDDGFAPIGFGTPETSPGGRAHITIGGADTGTRPQQLTVFFVPHSTVIREEAEADPSLLYGDGHKVETVDISDADHEITVEVSGVTPGHWDVAVVAGYAD